MSLEHAVLEDPERRATQVRSVNPLAAQMLSERVCRHFHMLPIAYEDGVVTIAAATPPDALARDVAAALTGHEVGFVLVPADQVERAIDAAFGATAAALEMPAEQSDPETYEELGVAAPLPLGKLLVARGAATPEQIDAALAEQQRTGSRLGEILVHNKTVEPQTLVTLLAEQFELPLVDLDDFEPDPDALAAIPEPVCRQLRVLPLGIDHGTLYVAVDDTLDAEALAELHKHTTLEIRSLLATGAAIDELTRRVYRERYVHVATNDLLERFPEDCANRVVTAGQRIFLGLTAAIIVVLVVLFPIPTLVGLVGAASLFYAAVSIYKLKITYAALGHQYEVQITDEDVANLDERTLPMYTILVPLFREAAVIPTLVAGVEGLDYPKTKLDVRLLCEEGDDETIDAIRALDLPPHYRLVIVPDSQPKTKPKACNYGLLQAEGHYCVIYDAEDRPAPDQLKRIIIAFQRVPPAVTCVQAKLNYFNPDQNLLTRWFSIEYSMWFDLILPGLDAQDVPIPLGGTSNHFVTERLIELGAWDPYNVTEDADLGIRLSKAGYQTAIIDSVTLEEANSQLSNWIRQRSRWIKGYIQTWLVHMRHPLALLRSLGFKSFISFQLIVGGTFIFLMNPIFWGLTTVFFFTHAGIIRDLFPSFVFYAAAFLLFIGNFVFVYLNVAGALERRSFHLVKYALLSPLYWGLMSLAAWKGFLQLFTKPFFWEKTEHGLDQAGS